MKYKLKAFTLTELLVALGIIGAIAALSIPSLMNAINNRMMVTQLKSNFSAIQQLVTERLATSPSKSLEDTDFGSPTKLLTESNFSIQKKCPKPAADCWKTTAQTNPVTYKTINKTTAKIADNNSSVMLKNGTVLSYERFFNTEQGKKVPAIGEFCFDINGPDYPNIIGRDYFCVMLHYNGRLDGIWPLQMAGQARDYVKECKNGNPLDCTQAILEADWTMPY